MRNGFNFKGIHSSEFGVSVKTKSRPIRPSGRTVLKSVPFRDGSYDFSSSNPYGREFYNDRSFSVALSVCADNMTLMQRKLNSLSKWLCGKGELIFDDMPFVKWRAMVIDEIIYVPEHDGRKAVFEVNFNAGPFSECVFDTNGPHIGVDYIVLDENIPIGIDEVYTYTISGRGDISIMNVGDRPMMPVIDITGDAGSVVLEMNGKLLAFNASGAVRVDFDRQCVESTDGMVKVTGEFFEFGEGENVLHIENSNTAMLTVKVNYTPKFMYNLYLDDMDWGVDDA